MNCWQKLLSWSVAPGRSRLSEPAKLEVLAASSKVLFHNTLLKKIPWIESAKFKVLKHGRKRDPGPRVYFSGLP